MVIITTVTTMENGNHNSEAECCHDYLYSDNGLTDRRSTCIHVAHLQTKDKLYRALSPARD